MFVCADPQGYLDQLVCRLNQCVLLHFKVRELEDLFEKESLGPQFS